MLLIQSSTLNMRKTEIKDLTFAVASENGLENSRFITPWTYEQHVAALTNDDMMHLTMENKQGEQAGYMIVTGLLDANKAVCVKRITNKIKGHAHGKEAMRLIIKWVFENTDTHRLWLDVKDFNSRARHVYESVGFIFEGTLREPVQKAINFK